MSWLTRYLYEAISLEEAREKNERAIASYLEVLLVHMLKCEYQYDYENKSSWRASIKNSFNGMFKAFGSQYKGVLYKNYYLKDLSLPGVYAIARDIASEETGIDLEVFPRYCPWTKKQLVDRDFINDFIKEYGYGKKEV